MDRSSREGSVLIIVLLVLVAAAYLIMESGKFLRIDYAGAASQRLTVSGGSLLRSGLNVASELLIDDYNEKERGDHQFEDWYDADEFYKSISNSLKSGEIEGKITAENAKFNINWIGSGSKKDENTKIDGFFKRLVDGVKNVHGIEGNAQSLINSIKVWRGITVKGNADGAWYAKEEPSYSISKKDFKSPHELLLVRWGDMSMEKRRKFLYGDGSKPGLIQFITVWGKNKKINMNLAPPEIIAASFPLNDADKRQEFVGRIIGKRNDAANNFSTNTWYKDVVRDSGVFGSYPLLLMGVDSDAFRVDLTVSIGAGKIRSTAILERRTKEKECVVMFENIH